MNINLKNIEEICICLAISAGSKIMEIYEDEVLFQEIYYKSDKSPLTIADTMANKIIIAGLNKHFPSYSILSEEEKDNLERLDNAYCFIVDPLDGTKEFIKRNGQFTVNIALAYEHEAVLGVIYVPATKELYYASQGNGCFYKNKQGDMQKITVSSETDLKKVRLVMSSSHGCEEMENIIKKYNFNKFIKMGSSLKGCLVARGEAEIYYRHNPTMEWDTAAMQCIVEEAGGLFRQMDGSKMLYNRVNSLNDKGFFAINCNQNIV